MPQQRIASIDIFRGLTILTMVFVNDVGHATGVPLWMRHAKDGTNTMTFVDVVFPAFLFIAGASIPFAVGGRMAAGESLLRVFGHILKRTLGLLLVGVFMVNTYRYAPDAAPIGKHLWALLMYVGVGLVWNQYPRTEGTRRTLFAAMRVLGAALLIGLAIAFRGREGDVVTGMRTSWWGIVGLIGWAYLVSATVYMLSGGQTAALVAAIALMTAVNIGDRAGAFDRLATLKQYIFLGGHIGGHASVMLAGVLLGTLFGDRSPCTTPQARIRWLLGLGAALAAAGYLLRPLYGISKNNATPTWCLYSAAIGCVAYAVLHVLVDLQAKGRWFGFVEPAGANPLLAYILPSVLVALLGVLHVTYLETHWRTGTTGIVRSAIFSLIIVWFAGVLHRRHVRLRL